MSDRATELRNRLAVHMRMHGLKQTRQREVVFECFLGSEHVSVDELLSLIQKVEPGVGYATVYRTLKLFQEAGVAHQRRFGDGQARYEPVDLDDEHHDHLICNDCGHIFEFDDDVIEDRQAKIAQHHGLAIVAHRHELYGSCISPESCEYREDGASA